MTRATKVKIGLGGLAAAALTLAPLGGGALAKSSQPKVVSVEDNVYLPYNVKIKEDGKVKWVWSINNTQTHNVVLKKAPKGVNKKQFKSGNASSNFQFTKKFTVPGKYHFVCTFHNEMTMDVQVNKK